MDAFVTWKQPPCENLFEGRRASSDAIEPNDGAGRVAGHLQLLPECPERAGEQ
jgi:hypothetical protein